MVDKMNLLDKIDIKIFFISLTIGLFMTYLFTPPPKIFYKYPTPDTVDDLVYRDTVNNCFKYSSNQVKCPSNKKVIKKIPTQLNY